MCALADLALSPWLSLRSLPGAPHTHFPFSGQTKGQKGRSLLVGLGFVLRALNLVSVKAVCFSCGPPGRLLELFALPEPIQHLTVKYSLATDHQELGLNSDILNQHLGFLLLLWRRFC